MLDLPTGTVTFLFTDIEGSTRRWEHHPEAMRRALARHDTLLRQVITAHGGVVFKMVGDAVYAAFAMAADAVAAALAAQRAVMAEEWSEVAPHRCCAAARERLLRSPSQPRCPPALSGLWWPDPALIGHRRAGPQCLASGRERTGLGRTCLERPDTA